ncbi:MAG: hydantoinase/oxoprolinase family protein [Thermodesulfobacteriota bacterium]
MARYKMGIDVGGTFTDGVLLDESRGTTFIVKVPSTPADSSLGFLHAVDRIIEHYNIQPEAVDFLVHGTTVATNAVIEGKTAKTALVTTKGFRDILEIAFQIRPRLYDVFVEKPRPLVPRRYCFEVEERLDSNGNVITPLREQDVDHVIEQLRKEAIESVVICLLHSYANNDHEKAVSERIHQKLPQIYVTISSEICNEFREYTRASTAVINGAIIPIVGKYLDRIETGLRQRKILVDCHLMQSSGGIVDSQIARTKPAFIVESGPAAGVIVSQYIGVLTGYKNLLALDIGGTTAKIGMVLDGQPRITRELEVGAAAFARSTAKRANGYPLRTPSIDLVEIGAGGGSIAWIDSGGVLRVGPESAGASPGPACYPQGGSLPTLTDANVVLGRLNPDYFLGGEMKLDKQAAVKSIKEHCAEKVAKSVVETALGIVAVAVSNMVNAVRFITVERGYDPRDFSLITTGGAGPLHGCLLAQELNIPRIIVPKNPGLASALGLLVTDVKQEVSTTVANIRNLELSTFGQILSDLEQRVRSLLESQKIPKGLIEIQTAADMRYSRQSYELTIHFDFKQLKHKGLKYLDSLFHKEHERAYGFSVKGEETKIVSLKVIGLGKIKKHVPPKIPEGSRNPSREALKERRQVYLDDARKPYRCAIYDREQLRSGNVIVGPAIIEEVDSTTVVLPGLKASVDRYGNLLITSKILSR